ncbi:MAG: polyamine aminopropyltransferase [Marinisporobacter sp.]|jgi:spermidine synthase|nr:polyamine aminopropyltransferase [Marinisporobacter sp.]
MTQRLKVKPLILSIFMISICSIVYELIIAGISTYLLGNSIMQFSITIGLYMSAMGLGSYLSRFCKNHLFDTFAGIELGIGMIGGISGILLFAAYAYTNIYVFVMYVVIIIIGILVGLEIPLLTRIVEDYNQDLRVTLANVLSFDYLGGLLGSVLFPLLLFPHLGFIRTSFLIGVINVLVAGIMIRYYGDFLEKKKHFFLLFWICTVVLAGGFMTGQYSADQIEQSLYRDQIVYSKQTPYQKIVLTKHRDDLRLFLDGNIQFSSMDEYRYHEALIHPIMSLAHQKENILILGGGDGLAVRELLKYSQVKKIDLVDIDRDMVNLCKENSLVVGINQGALSNEKVALHFEDAYKYLENSKSKYDVVIVDLPDPNNESLNNLYTNTFYRLIGNHLKSKGLMVVQSTSPYYAKEAFWCVNKTIQRENFQVKPYHIQVPSFGEWGFQLASKESFDINNITLNVPTQFLQKENILAMFAFAKDEKVDMEKIEPNCISRPILLRYYQKAEERF